MLRLFITARFALCPGMFLFASLALTLAGCGPSRGNLTGKVSYQGKTVRSGAVQVACSDGIHVAKIEPDGTYLAKEIPVGIVKISVSSPNPAVSRQMPNRKGELPPPPAGDATGWFEIPEHYADFETSELTH